MNCLNIGANLIAANCDNPAVAGTGKRVVLLNYDDVDRALSVEANNVISSIVMKATKKGYKFESLGDSTLGESSLNKGTYFNTWKHDLTLRIFAKTEPAKDFANKLAGSKVIAIVENNEIGASGELKYEVYGFESGLELSEATASTDMGDKVVYQLKLSSNDKSTESSLPKSYFKTDLATTETALNSLIAA